MAKVSKQRDYASMQESLRCCDFLCSEVLGSSGHVQDLKDAPQVCAVAQGPDPAVFGRQR